MVNSEQQPRNIIVIGASAGGFQAVCTLLSKLPSDLPALLGIVIHRGAQSQSNWSITLGRCSTLRVIEPTHHQRLTQGVVYIAPSDMHMTFCDERVSLDQSVKHHHTRPAVDPLFSSAARAYKERVVGIVLSGGGHDGMHGLREITAAGGLSLVQKPAEAEFASMPEYSLAHDHVHAALTLDALADILPRLALGDAVDIATRSTRSPNITRHIPTGK